MKILREPNQIVAQANIEANKLTEAHLLPSQETQP
jgi:hypothetical protein